MRLDLCAGRRAFLAGTAGALLAAGGPKRRSAAQSRTRIVFAWPFLNGPQGVQELAERFNQQSRTVEVTVQIVPQLQALPRLTEMFDAGTGPDCLAISDIWLTQLASRGWLEPLDDRLAADGLEADIAPASMGLARMYRGTAYYVGFVIESFLLFYNRRLFEAAGLSGPPTTLDEFADHAQRLTDRDQDRFGCYVEGGDGWSFQQWTTWALGTGGAGLNRTFFDASGRCVLNSPRHAAGLQQWLDLYQKSKVSPPESALGTLQDQTAAFASGRVAMIMGWGSFVATMAAAVGEDNLGTAPTPEGPAGAHYYYAGNGFALNAASAKKDASWEFIRFMLQPENNGAWNRRHGAIPTNMQAWQEDWLRQERFQSMLAVLQDQNALVHHPRHLPGYGSFQSQFSPPQIQQTLLGGQDAAEHLATIAGALEKLLADAA